MNRKDVEALIEAAKAGGYQVNLHGADLAGVDLSGLDLSEANLHGADLTDADLSGTILARANLHGATLVGAVTDEETTLEKANCHGAKFGKATLIHKDTWFEGANVTASDAPDSIKQAAKMRSDDPIFTPPAAKKKGK